MGATECAVFVLNDFEPGVRFGLFGLIDVDQVPEHAIIFHDGEPNSRRRRGELFVTHMETSGCCRLLLPPNCLCMAYWILQ